MFLFLEQIKIPPKYSHFLTEMHQSITKYTPRKEKGEDRQKKIWRKGDKYKKASHGPYRSILYAKNSAGVRDPKIAKATINIYHGLRGYAGLYEKYGEHHLNIKGYNNVILDFPGHGKNPGEPCHIHHIKYFEECVGSAIVEAHGLNPDIPIILIAFSMGGLITLQYLFDTAPYHIKSHIAGIACLGVPLEVGQDVPKWKLLLAPIIAWCAPTWKQKELCIDKDNINHDPIVVKEILEDEMIYKGPLPAWTAYSIQKMAQNVYSLVKNKGYRRLGIPIIFLRGELDTTAQRSSYDKAGVPVIDISGFKHEILKGSGSEVVREILDAWIEKVVLPTWELSVTAKKLNANFFKEHIKEII
jgi:alpha-beta hydrolase superfamily lysophospholipase